MKEGLCRCVCLCVYVPLWHLYFWTNRHEAQHGHSLGCLVWRGVGKVSTSWYQSVWVGCRRSKVQFRLIPGSNIWSSWHNLLRRGHGNRVGVKLTVEAQEIKAEKHDFCWSLCNPLKARDLYSSLLSCSDETLTEVYSGYTCNQSCMEFKDPGTPLKGVL